MSKKDESPTKPDLEAQLAEAQKEKKKALTIAATAKVDAALAAGKITEAQKTWAMSYAQSDLDGFDAFIASAPSAAGVTPPQDNLYAATHTPGGQGESFDVVKMAVGGTA